MSLDDLQSILATVQYIPYDFKNNVITLLQQRIARAETAIRGDRLKLEESEKQFAFGRTQEQNLSRTRSTLDKRVTQLKTELKPLVSELSSVEKKQLKQQKVLSLIQQEIDTVASTIATSVAAIDLAETLLRSITGMTELEEEETLFSPTTLAVEESVIEEEDEKEELLFSPTTLAARKVETDEQLLAKQLKKVKKMREKDDTRARALLTMDFHEASNEQVNTLIYTLEQSLHSGDTSFEDTFRQLFILSEVNAQQYLKIVMDKIVHDFFKKGRILYQIWAILYSENVEYDSRETLLALDMIDYLYTICIYLNDTVEDIATLVNFDTITTGDKIMLISRRSPIIEEHVAKTLNMVKKQLFRVEVINGEPVTLDSKGNAVMLMDLPHFNTFYNIFTSYQCMLSVRIDQMVVEPSFEDAGTRALIGMTNCLQYAEEIDVLRMYLYTYCVNNILHTKAFYNWFTEHCLYQEPFKILETLENSCVNGLVVVMYKCVPQLTQTTPAGELLFALLGKGSLRDEDMNVYSQLFQKKIKKAKPYQHSTSELFTSLIARFLPQINIEVVMFLSVLDKMHS
jgi:hypothetical protein